MPTLRPKLLGRYRCLVASSRGLCLVLLMPIAGAIAGCAYTPERPLETVPSYSAGALDPRAINVLSWNIEKGQGENWAQALQSGYTQEQLLAFDLLLVQEACVHPARGLQDLGPALERRGYGWYFATSFVSGAWGCGNGQATGVVVASRVEPVETLALRSHDSEFALTPKASLALLFPLAGRHETLLVINSHMLNFQLFSNSDYEKQLSELLDLIDQHPGPLIFAGDLNTRNQKRLDLLADAMAPRCLETVLPRQPDTRTRDRLNNEFALDHIIFRGLQATSPLFVGQEQQSNISDHNSIAASLRVVRGNACDLYAS